MLVHAHLEKRLAEQTQERAHLIARFIAGLEAEATERRAKDAALDARVDKLASGISELIQRMAAR